jgi:branched-chain amino acid aminotransferase
MDASNAALYGRGIFSTIAFFGVEPFLWDKHWRRLTNNASVAGIDLLGHDQNSTKELLSQIIASNGLAHGKMRLTFRDESPSPIWSRDSQTKTGLSTLIAESRPVPANFKLSFSPYPVNSLSPLAGVKSCNYLEQILSLDEANRRGFHEAVRLNERGQVTSGCMSNIFWLKNDRLYTPSLATGCLAGTTREYVLENIECEEVEAEIGELGSADAIFLTSAGLGIVSVAEFNGRVLTETKPSIQTLWPAQM